MTDPNTPQDDEQFPEYSGQQENQQQTLDKGTPAVSSAPGKSLPFLVGLVAILAFMLYTFFGGEEKKPKDTLVAEQTEGERPVHIAEKSPDFMPPPPPPPPAPAQITVPPPPPPPPPPASGGGMVFNDPDNVARKERYRSDMMSYNKNFFRKGKEAPDSQNPRGGASGASSDDPNSSFLSRNYDEVAPKVKSGVIGMGDTTSTIAQGKMIDAVLETAINTDLPGMLRAIVSRDIYAEQGRSILLPKGSRLVGTYNTGIRRGQKRVYVVWTRVIRPDGIDVMVNSEGVDQLGRAGVAGEVDSKYMEIFSSAFLTSVLTLGAATAVEGMVDDPQVSRRLFNDGSIETTGSPTSIAGVELVQNVGRAANMLIDEFIDIRPTITVNQGTPLKVFVNRDLIFPESTQNSIRVIQ